MNDIIAVDGEAAAGKSVCDLVAKKLGYALLDSGSIYRALAWRIGLLRIDPNDKVQVKMKVKHTLPRLGFRSHRIAFDGDILGNEIRTEEISRIVPLIAKQPAVRKLILPLQRGFNGGDRLIAEGRDMGSVVFPKARIKIYLTASLEVRAKRRHLQILERDPSSEVTYDEVLLGLKERDRLDKTRTESPLVRLPEAHIIDSTDLTKEQVVERMLGICRH